MFELYVLIPQFVQLAEPEEGENVPTGQLWQTLVAVGAYSPAEHAAHPVWSPFTIDPAAHVKQKLPPEAMYLPLRQGSHPDATGERAFWPAPHKVHELKPAVAAYFPLVHASQFVLPTSLVKVPILQSVQELEPEVVKVDLLPVWQSSQVEAPSDEVYFPPLQLLQVEEPEAPTVLLYFPAEQLIQSALDPPGAEVETTYLPATQETHAVLEESEY